ncbi:peptidoglycan DD-metalloendopeptidase family protein [Acetobacter sp. LMG 32666]|uniref:murein hydrolase activator EnvC family protein n=1 Tax=Acetobacter sp. LMG 32666 TaxID=2959295 RepID=UPI0030C8733E
MTSPRPPFCTQSPSAKTRRKLAGATALLLGAGLLCPPLAWGAEHAGTTHTARARQAGSAPPHTKRHTLPTTPDTLAHAHTTARGRQGHSVLEAQEAVAAARAQHQAMEMEKTRQAAAIEASRLKNDAAQAAAAQAKNQALALSAATVTATSQLHDTEQQISDLSERIGAIRDEQRNLQATLRANAQALGPILPLAERLSLYPSDTLLAAPVPQGDAVTGFLILKGLSRQMEVQAQAMRAQQARLSSVDKDLSAQYATLAGLKQNQSQQRDTVRQQAALARIAQQQASRMARSAAQQLLAATQRASSLQDAIARLDALEDTARAALQREIAAAEQAHQAGRARAARQQEATLSQNEGPGLAERGTGAGVQPVAGRLVSGWGVASDSGPTTGLTYRTPPGASVRAPCSGSVDFAGAFRSYGQMVILNCGRHYRFVLAGLSELSVDTAQSLTKGAPLGHMSATGSSATLFIQLRNGQKTVNPAPFL